VQTLVRTQQALPWAAAVHALLLWAAAVHALLLVLLRALLVVLLRVLLLLRRHRVHGMPS
jgi:hypothetical protein